MILPLARRQALTKKAHALAGNVDHAMPYLLERGLSREVADLFQLGYVLEGPMKGRLSIPYFTPRGGVVDMKYRCMDPEHGNHKQISCPKYLKEAGCYVHLFNAQALIGASDLVVVTEGELDAITVQAYCAIPAVAYPGVNAWDVSSDEKKQSTKHFKLCFEGVGDVVVVADGDDTGRNAARRVAESIGMQARVVDMPDGEDANDFVRSKTAAAFLERIKQ